MSDGFKSTPQTFGYSSLLINFFANAVKTQKLRGAHLLHIFAVIVTNIVRGRIVLESEVPFFPARLCYEAKTDCLE